MSAEMSSVNIPNAQASALQRAPPQYPTWVICVDSATDTKFYYEIFTGLCAPIDAPCLPAVPSASPPLLNIAPPLPLNDSHSSTPVFIVPSQPPLPPSNIASRAHFSATATSIPVARYTAKARARSLSPPRRRLLRHTFGRIDAMPDLSTLSPCNRESAVNTSVESKPDKEGTCTELLGQKGAGGSSASVDPTSDDESTVSCDGSCASGDTLERLDSPDPVEQSPRSTNVPSEIINPITSAANSAQKAFFRRPSHSKANVKWVPRGAETQSQQIAAGMKAEESIEGQRPASSTYSRPNSRSKQNAFHQRQSNVKSSWQQNKSFDHSAGSKSTAKGFCNYGASNRHQGAQHKDPSHDHNSFFGKAHNPSASKIKFFDQVKGQSRPSKMSYRPKKDMKEATAA